MTPSTISKLAVEMPLAPVKSAPCIFASLKIAREISAPRKYAPDSSAASKLTPVQSAIEKSAPTASAPEKSEEARLEPISSALPSLMSVARAPRRSAPVKLEPHISLPSISTLRMLALEKSHVPSLPRIVACISEAEAKEAAWLAEARVGVEQARPAQVRVLEPAASKVDACQFRRTELGVSQV
eukprot:CAMPEP_0183378786 /NCGR_PEP_ID=MMETSP0164_2-20130417/125095_1 /TAXON_ID=221442 /ORGANISM="Coccolithus pelagicus ssp braarudi, Strain PLY182g" /LENGTH=183 /DNA_ID=CAMNT_0025556359 /DNA_START=491 /DNA_END=1041 /DNA_ORIENTATION=+